MILIKKALFISIITFLCNGTSVFSKTGMVTSSIDQKANELEVDDVYDLPHVIQSPIKTWGVERIEKTNKFKIIYLNPYQKSKDRLSKFRPKFLKDVLTITIRYIQVEDQYMHVEGPNRLEGSTLWELDKVLTLSGKILLGALAVEGAFLATTFAPAYLNHLYEAATPWLNPLRDTFQSVLEKFKFSSK